MSRVSASRFVVTIVAGVLAGFAASACDDGVEQGPACARYTACIRALDAPLGRQTDLERFDVGGPCWGSEEGATLCERACVRGLAWEAQRNANPPIACAPIHD